MTQESKNKSSGRTFSHQDDLFKTIEKLKDASLKEAEKQTKKRRLTAEREYKKAQNHRKRGHQGEEQNSEKLREGEEKLAEIHDGASPERSEDGDHKVEPRRLGRRKGDSDWSRKRLKKHPT